MHRTIIASLTVSALCAQASAHDFWIEPQNYAGEANEEMILNVFVGHGEDKVDWPVAPHRIIGLRSLGPNGLSSHVKGPQSVTSPWTVNFDEDGLHMLFVETTNSFSELAAEKFDSYVEEEGIRPIAVDRVRNRKSEDPGREIYSRRGKALMQIGCGGGNDAWRQNLGLTLEITPGINPFEWDDGEAFPVTVSFHGDAVPGATLHVTNLEDESESFSMTAEDDGQADLGAKMSEGRWLVHTVWSEAAPRLLQDADYQTVFSSLTFETMDACASE
jgi:uncharacterized GH25 family protein